jgi:hypothetical protein
MQNNELAKTVILHTCGGQTLTIPHMFCKRKDSGFPFGCADTAAAEGRRGNNAYHDEVSLCQFGRGKPRLGDLPMEQTTARQDSASDAKKTRGTETLGVARRIRPDPKKRWCVTCVAVYTRIYSDILVYTNIPDASAQFFNSILTAIYVHESYMHECSKIRNKR